MGSFHLIKSGGFLPGAFVNLSADSRAGEGNKSPIKDFKPEMVEEKQ